MNNKTSVKLYTKQSRFPLVITPIVAKYAVMQDMDNPFVEVILNVVDANNTLDKYQITGGENISIAIGRLRMNLVVSEVFDYVRKEPQKQYFSLRCISPEVVQSSKKILRRAFKGTPMDMITNIITQDLNSPKYAIEAESKGQIQGIYPTIRPIEAVQWLINSSMDSATPIYFFACAHDGLKVVSQKSLLEGRIVATYSFLGWPNPVPLDKIDYNIKRMSSPLSVSEMYQDIAGGQRATTNVLDISKKDYLQYDYGNAGTLDKTFHVSTNSLAYGDILTNMHGVIAAQTGEYNAQHVRLEKLTQNITIAGNTNLKLGDKINIRAIKTGEPDILKRDPDEKHQVGIDAYMSRPYIITRIESTLSPADDVYAQNLTIKAI